MKVVISGGSGLVGVALAKRLIARGDDAVILSRTPASVTVGRGVAWDPGRGGAWADEVASADAVVNLAGASIADGRWTEARKRELRGSRLTATEAIVAAMSGTPKPGRVLVSASAVGYYGARGDEELPEGAPPGQGFLSDLSVEWENAARRAQPVARVVVVRIGIVLSMEGGALPKMALPFKAFVGGRIGDGRQWMSWIHIDDLVHMILWAIDTPSVSGALNATAPSPVTNAQFMDALGKALGRPSIFPVPGFALRILVGELADPLLLTGQRVIPRGASGSGFEFRYENLDSAFANLLR